MLWFTLLYAHLLSIMRAGLPGEPGLAGFIGAKDNGSGGDNWSYKTCKAPVNLSPLTNQHPTFYRADAVLLLNQQLQSTERKEFMSR